MQQCHVEQFVKVVVGVIALSCYIQVTGALQYACQQWNIKAVVACGAELLELMLHMCDSCNQAHAAVAVDQVESTWCGPACVHASVAVLHVSIRVFL